jgi:hypothetical protein
VTFSDDTVITATLVGRDPFADLAVIKVPSLPSGVQPLTLTHSDDLRVGQIVVALGNPFGLPGSMTTGIISGLGRELPAGEAAFRLPGAIQTDAAINPGNSGGPLLDLDGRVIGINTAIESPSGAFAGVGFAVPSDQIARVIPTLIREGHYRYPWIGVDLLTVTPEVARELGLKTDHGALIGSVSSGSPAEKAGLKGGGTTRDVQGQELRSGGDIITAVDGRPVKASEEVVYGEISTGAQNDLQQASALARRMVQEFGMSKLGPVAFTDAGTGSEQLTGFLRERPYSEALAQAINDEIRAIVQTNYQRARSLLVGCQPLLEELAAELKQREEIGGAELRERIGRWRTSAKRACSDSEPALWQPHVEQAVGASLATTK